jgi:signal transduction histidine kinase/ABC-type uncharacterized transport system substrate-binding protein
VSARAHPRQTRRSLIRVVQPLFGESGWEAPRALSCVAVSLLLLFLFLVQGLAKAQAKPIRRVLVLSDLGAISSPGFAEVDQALLAGLQKSPYQIEFYNEALELTLFSDEGSQRRIHEDFIRKYSDRRLDLIIAAGSASLSFLESNEGFLRNTPIVFCAVLENISAQPNRNMHITGVLGRLHPMETLDAALHLAPFTKHVVVVGGMGTFDEPWEAIARQAFRKYEPQVEFTYVTDLTMPALLERLKHLPSNTIVYHTAITQDAAGNHFIDSAQSVPLVASAANAPVFVMDDVDLRDGTVGGDLVNWANDGRAAADMAVRILNGERPEDIPVVASKHAYMFDWRALQRWGLKESDLPPSSIVLNRPPSFWQLYKRYVLAGVLMLVAQALVIVALLWQRARRRNTENELAIMYDRLRMAIEAGRFVGWDVDIRTGKNQWFGDLETMFGIPSGTFSTEMGELQRHIHRDDVDGVTRAIDNARENQRPYVAEFRITRHNREVRWVIARGKFYYASNGDPERMLGLALDITERKLAEEALSSVSRRLIQAEEQERVRIARELHDDINQRMAMLEIDLNELKERSPESAADVPVRLEELRARVSDISMEIQAIAHRLHSSKLEYLGLAAACKGFCKEVAERQKVSVEFKAGNVPPAVPRDISLTLFRVLQESLQNAIKHSGALKFEVDLRGTPGEIELVVRDYGVGFDVGTALESPGLGLVSMRERLSLVKGTILIESKPMCGTQINVRVPVIAAKSVSHLTVGEA